MFMGMGEPLANYDNVMEAVRRIHDELGIGARHITVSTVRGWGPSTLAHTTHTTFPSHLAHTTHPRLHS